MQIPLGVIDDGQPTLPALNTPAIISGMQNSPFPSPFLDDGMCPVVKATKAAGCALRATTDRRCGQQPAFSLCTGPLTGLAWLLQVTPDLKDEITSIVWMGGFDPERARAARSNPPGGNI